jgi:hypothetical protein
LDQYSQIIRTLKGAGLVAEKSSELTWIGPTLDQYSQISRTLKGGRA